MYPCYPRVRHVAEVQRRAEPLNHEREQTMSIVRCTICSDLWGLLTVYQQGWKPSELDQYECPDCKIREGAPISEPTNSDRRSRARVALQFYVQLRGETYEASTSEIADLIADLLHLTAEIDERGDGVQQTLNLARLHFDAENENPEHER